MLVCSYRPQVAKSITNVNIELSKKMILLSKHFPVHTKICTWGDSLPFRYWYFPWSHKAFLPLKFMKISPGSLANRTNLCKIKMLHLGCPPHSEWSVFFGFIGNRRDSPACLAVWRSRFGNPTYWWRFITANPRETFFVDL